MGGVTRPTVSDAQAWQPDSLREAALSWQAAATDVHADIEIAVQGVAATREVWTGSAAEAARDDVLSLGRTSDALARAMVLAAVAARDGADQIEIARTAVLDLVSTATSEGFAVADDGAVAVHDAPTSLLVALSGGDAALAGELQASRAQELTAQVGDALDRLGAADADAGTDIEEAFATLVPKAAATVPAGAASAALFGDVVAGWPVTGQDRIAEQIATLTPEQRQRLVADFPGRVGNTDGVPWEMRIAANRTNIAQAILDEHDPARAAFYRTLLGEVDDPAGGGRIDRQIVAFDPARASLVELNGDLSVARGVAVLVPGMNTTIEGSAANSATARRFVAATNGDVAVLTYLGGPFPRGNLVSGVVDAASPRYALDMAPRLVAFSEDVDRTVDAVAADREPVPVTYIGHSYGGSILGTAEAMGLTADQTMYVAAAGAGVGIDDPGDWHNRNPGVVRYSMTAPGDLIQAVQGIPGGPHGADPDEMPGVIHLATGHYDDGRLMAGWQAHSDILNSPSDSWRNILAVITGDRERIRPAG